MSACLILNRNSYSHSSVLIPRTVNKKINNVFYSLDIYLISAIVIDLLMNIITYTQIFRYSLGMLLVSCDVLQLYHHSVLFYKYPFIYQNPLRNN